MSCTMRVRAFVVACTACAANGSSLHMTRQQFKGDSSRELVALLLAIKHFAAGWHVTGGNVALNSRNYNSDKFQYRRGEPRLVDIQMEHPNSLVSTPHQTSRRAALASAMIVAMLPSLAKAFGASGNDGITGARSRPVTGVVLVDEVKESGPKNAPLVQAEIVLDGGIIANVEFQAQPGYPVNRGMFYDVEVRAAGRSESAAFVHVAKLPNGSSITDVEDKFFTKSIFATTGRYSAYGAPSNIKITKKSDKESTFRTLDVKFDVQSPSGIELPEKITIAALQPKGTQDVVMLVGGSSEQIFPSVEPSLRKMASTFRIGGSRPTNLKRAPLSDYRFQDFGGLRESKLDEEQIF